MKRTLDLIIVGASLFVSITACKPGNYNAEVAATHRGSETEWKTKSSVFGQEYFHYKAGMKSYKLKKKAATNERIFLSHPTFQRWVYGQDYQYDDVKNEIQFLKNPPCLYGLGRTRDEAACLGENHILWVFYWPKKELDSPRSEFGSEASIEAATFMDGITKDDVPTLRISLSPDHTRLKVYRQGPYFYDRDAVVVYNFLIKKGVQQGTIAD
jgi:hypothetical protein